MQGKQTAIKNLYLFIFIAYSLTILTEWSVWFFTLSFCSLYSTPDALKLHPCPMFK